MCGIIEFRQKLIEEIIAAKPKRFYERYYFLLDFNNAKALYTVKIVDGHVEVERKIENYYTKTCNLSILPTDILIDIYRKVVKKAMLS